MSLSQSIAFAVVALVGGLWGSTSESAEPASDIPGNFVPVRAEPAFEVVSYTVLRSGIAMVVRMSTADIIELVEKRYPQLKSERTYLSLSEEELITSGQRYYRRVTLTNTDLDTGGIHGHCSQWIRVWFSQSGTVVDVYPDRQGCPV